MRSDAPERYNFIKRPVFHIYKLRGRRHMDRKDLELLKSLHDHGRVDPCALAPMLNITEANVHRRIVLMQKEGIIKGFSAFFDRRSLGHDTTFLKVHYQNRRREQTLSLLRKHKRTASIYPNIDDFAIVEIVHEDTDALKNSIGRFESLSEECTVTAAYTPRLPDTVPDLDRKRDLPLVMELVRDGYATERDLSRSLKIPEGEITERLSHLLENGGVRILPLIAEEAITPYPCFSFIIIVSDESYLAEVMNAAEKATQYIFMRAPLRKPSGLWFRSFGSDLHAMDHTLERIRRLPYVEELTVVLPDGVEYVRDVDIEVLRGR
jgi:DNA-binding Lrp family transcriptional regulator